MGIAGDEPSPALISMGGSPVERLRRWEESGAVWRVLFGPSPQLTVAFLRCDGGEEVDRLVSDHPDLLAFVAARSASDD